ncbi:MAG: Arm DNA-binding domain-containing protein, partial [Lepagella sp.]
MASTKFYLDQRNVADGCECPLKIAIYTTDRSAFINLGIKLLPKQWDRIKYRVVNHPQKEALNVLLNQRKQE